MMHTGTWAPVPRAVTTTLWTPSPRWLARCTSPSPCDPRTRASPLQPPRDAGRAAGGPVGAVDDPADTCQYPGEGSLCGLVSLMYTAHSMSYTSVPTVFKNREGGGVRVRLGFAAFTHAMHTSRLSATRRLLVCMTLLQCALSENMHSPATCLTRAAPQAFHPPVPSHCVLCAGCSTTMLWPRYRGALWSGGTGAGCPPQRPS